MIRLHFGDFPVDMQSSTELGTQIFDDFAGGYDFVTGDAGPGFLIVPVKGGGSLAQIRLFGAFAYDPMTGFPVQESTVNQIEIYSHADVLTNPAPGEFPDTWRLVASGLPNLPIDTVIDNVLDGRDITGLYAGQPVEIRGSASFGDVLEGGDFDDDILGDGGNDVLFGNGGNDFLDGMTGTDSLSGGTGDDIYGVDAAGDVVLETPAQGIDLVRSAISYKLPANVDDLALADFGTAEDGTGNAIRNVIMGNDFDNRLSGLGGNDTLGGGAGNDTLDGGTGIDSMSGGDGNDRLVWQGQAADSFDGGAGIDALKLIGGDLDLTFVANRQIRNVEQINMNAAGANSLTVNKADVLAISSSTDTLKVFGNPGDTVDLPSSFSDLGVAGSFHQYRNGAAIVLVDTDIDVV